MLGRSRNKKSTCMCTCLCTVLTSVLEGPRGRLKVLLLRALETIRDAVDYNHNITHKIQYVKYNIYRHCER